MSVWTALIVVAVSSLPLSAKAPNDGGPLNMTVSPNATDNTKENAGKPDAVKPPAITLGMTPADGVSDKAYRIGSMTGVEADVFVMTPAVTTLTFDTQAMCNTAADVLRKQSDVVSVGCVETK